LVVTAYLHWEKFSMICASNIDSGVIDPSSVLAIHLYSGSRADE
jgi:hypothetical protein